MKPPPATMQPTSPVIEPLLSGNLAIAPIRTDRRFARLRNWRVYLPIAAALLIGFGLPIAPIAHLIVPLFQRFGLSTIGAWRAGHIADEALDLAFLLVVILVWERRRLGSVGLRWPTLSDLGLGLGLFAATEAISFTVMTGLRFAGANHPAMAQMNLMYRVPLALALLAALINGVVEELIARGYAIERLELLTGSTLAAVAVAYPIDVALHVPFWGWRYALCIAPAEGLFVLMYLWRRNLSTCIFAHILNDAFPFAMAAAAPVLLAMARPGGYQQMRLLSYLEHSDYDRAISVYSVMIQRDPDNPDHYRDRAWAYAAKDDDAAAVADLTRALEHSDGDADLLDRRAYEELRLHQYSLAIGDYEAAIDADRDDDRAYNSIAWLLSTCPRPEVRDSNRALALAWKSCELSSWQDPEVIDTLAAAYAEAGDFEQAVMWERRAIELTDPEEERPEDKRARLLLYRAHQPYRENGPGDSLARGAHR